MSQTASGTSSAFLLETGPVADQSFAGGQSETIPTLIIGGGDYSAYFPTGQTTIDLTPALDGSNPISEAGFGILDTTTMIGYYSSLGYSNSLMSAIIAPNFQGLGLPKQLWFQVTNLLYNIEGFAATDLTCNPAAGESCVLSQACSSYSDLWSYSFKLNFEGQTNYVIVPLGAFAVNNSTDNTCNLYLQYLNDDQYVQSSSVVLGSMFLQQYINYWQYDLSLKTTTISM